MTLTRRLAVRLTDAEVLQRAEAAIALDQRIETERLTLKLEAKNARERIAELEAQRRPLWDAVSMRVEPRDVECRIVDGQVVRLDSGEIVGEPTDAERQRGLFESAA